MGSEMCIRDRSATWHVQGGLCHDIRGRAPHSAVEVEPARRCTSGPAATTGSLLEKQGWCQSCRLSAQAQGDLGALTRLLDGPTGQHRPIGHCTAARQPQDAEGGLYVHLADRRQHRPQHRVAGVTPSRSAGSCTSTGSTTTWMASSGWSERQEQRELGVERSVFLQEPDAPRGSNPTLRHTDGRRSQRSGHRDHRRAPHPGR